MNTIKVSIILSSIWAFCSYAQTTFKTITLEEAVTTALQNNKGVQVAQYQVDYNKSLKGTSTDIGKTNAIVMYGQYNSYYKDNNITISQTIPFPTVMHRQSQYFSAATKSAEMNKQVTENELRYNVKTAYYLLSFTKSKRDFLLKQDSIYANFLNAASIRLKAGATNPLEKATAESQLYEIRTLIEQNNADVRIYESQLQTLLNTTEQVTSTDVPLNKRSLELEADTLSVKQNPALQYFKQQLVVAKASTQLERSKFMPDITLGYFNQTLYGTINYTDRSIVSGTSPRFQGVMLGVAFPIWIRPQIARIKANEALQNASKANSELFQKNLQGKYEQAYQEYLKFKNSLDYYEINALPTADIISRNASQRYLNGRIGYMELSQGLSRALSIQTNYLSILSQYNQSIINIEFLIGNR